MKINKELRRRARTYSSISPKSCAQPIASARIKKSGSSIWINPNRNVAPPAFFVFDKRERFDERFDGGLLALRVIHLNAVGLEIGTDFDLINLAGGDRANRGELLQRFAIGILRARRVDDDAIAFVHPLHRRLFSVIELQKPVFDAFARCARGKTTPTPKITCVHEVIALAKLKLDSGFSELTLIC